MRTGSVYRKRIVHARIERLPDGADPMNIVPPKNRLHLSLNGLVSVPPGARWVLIRADGLI
jgi:hypothetical protein